MPATPRSASSWPQLYSSDGITRRAVLDTVHNAVVQDQMLDASGGQSVLDFNIVPNDPKAALLANELMVRVTYPNTNPVQQDNFIIRTITKGWDTQGQKVLAVHAECSWYDLGTMDAITVNSTASASAALTAILSGTGWTIGTISPSVSAATGGQTYQQLDHITPLAAIRALPAIFGGEISFDTINKRVSLLAQVGNPSTGIFYAHGSNLTADQRVIDTSQLTTRLRPVGGNSVDITTVNGGVAYVENYTFYDNLGWPRKVQAQLLTNDQITDANALLKWAQAQLTVLSQPKVTYVLQVAQVSGDLLPAVGDTVRVWDKELALDTYARVASRNIDLIQPFNSTLQINTALYTLVNAMVGTSQSTAVPVSQAADTLSPATPTAPTPTQLDSVDANGNHIETAVLTWNPVTTNANGSPIIDLQYYEVQWSYTYSGTGTSGGVVTTLNQVNIGVVPIGVIITFKVRAVDTSGNVSSWATTSMTVAQPSITPPTPSAPTLDTSLPLALRVIWDGNQASGSAMPATVDHVDVYRNTVNDNTTATRIGSMRTGMVWPATGLTAGTTYYFWLRAVDTAGTPGAFSAVASGVPLNVAANQISSLSVTQLTAGVLSADVTMSKFITTSSTRDGVGNPTGARVDITPIGIKAYDSGGNQTIAINNDGTATFAASVSAGTTITGALIRTAASGARLEISGAGNYLKFFDSTGATTIDIEGSTGAISIAGDLTGSAYRTGTEANHIAIVGPSSHSLGWDRPPVNTPAQIQLPSGLTVETVQSLVYSSAAAAAAHEPGANASLMLYGPKTTNSSQAYIQIRGYEANGPEYPSAGSDISLGADSVNLNGSAVKSGYASQFWFGQSAVSIKAIAGGTSTPTLDASGTATITHGLLWNGAGVAPWIVVATMGILSGGIYAMTGSYNATTFQVHVKTGTGADATGSPAIHWLAIA